ncbi:GDP-D-GLUCOSE PHOSPHORYLASE 1 [Salix purpurea]|uniref:GDP-D-GLUCOSE PHOSPHORYLASE 1 n=1 Tax=Salix purpurea TaxID=77065 RepID=A0A9Q1A6L3_SALPP|nr:GDP-D-GLUCOSE PHOSPHORYLASE 1 [Salix purpurea]
MKDPGVSWACMLLIPRVLDCLPQRIDCDSLMLAIYMAAEAGNPYFRLGYNSLGAFSTINHLHFQRIDCDSLMLAIYMAAEAGNPYFRLGYNSLGAFATISHLHFQVFDTVTSCQRKQYQVVNAIINANGTNTCQYLVETEGFQEVPEVG